MTLSISTKVLGQPWVMISGSGLGPVPGTWTKWIPSPSISVLNWGNRLIRSSCARQSNCSAQLRHSSRM